MKTLFKIYQFIFKKKIKRGNIDLTINSTTEGGIAYLVSSFAKNWKYEFNTTIRVGETNDETVTIPYEVKIIGHDEVKIVGQLIRGEIK